MPNGDRPSRAVHVFAFGSNMWTARLLQRTPSARAIATGHVTERRFAFHKLGADGSGKANAVLTGNEADRVWGVVFAMSRDDALQLDAHEPSYDPTTVTVRTDGAPLKAVLYVARPEVVDDSLVPFTWYRNLVVHGAVEHALPVDYVAALRTAESVSDPDHDRAARHAELLLR